MRLWAPTPSEDPATAGGQRGVQGHAAEACSVLELAGRPTAQGCVLSWLLAWSREEGGDRHRGTGWGAQCWWSWGLCELCYVPTWGLG